MTDYWTALQDGRSMDRGYSSEAVFLSLLNPLQSGILGTDKDHGHRHGVDNRRAGRQVREGCLRERKNREAAFERKNMDKTLVRNVRSRCSALTFSRPS